MTRTLNNECARCGEPYAKLSTETLCQEIVKGLCGDGVGAVAA